MKKFNKTQLFGSMVPALLISTLLLATIVAPIPNADAADTDIGVKAEEMLEVKIAKPASGSWATSEGKTAADFANGLFLYNKIDFSVYTNNTVGFTASMTTADNSRTDNDTTSLINQSDSDYTIPILGSNYTLANFPTNHWGFSYDENAGEATTATYRPIAAYGATPTYVASGGSSTTATTKSLYFGAKADLTIASGTYKNTVILSVVSGVNTSDTSKDETKPGDNPSTPSQDTPNDDKATYDSSIGQTAYTTYTNTTGTDNKTYRTTTTTVTPGNTTESTYASPQGVSTTAAINEGTPLATGLAVTAGVAATAGIIFFIIAKRRRDDDEEEEYQ